MNYMQVPSDNPAQSSIRELFTNLRRNINLVGIISKQNDGLPEDPNDISQRQEEGNKAYKKPLFTVNDMESTFLTLDRSLLYVGDNSTFQKRITWLLAIQWVSFSFMVNTMAFFFHSPSFKCRTPGTDFYEDCSESSVCSNRYDYIASSGSQ